MFKKIKEWLIKFSQRKNKELKEKEIIPTLKDPNEFLEVLSRMENLVQGKIDALKSSIPIFFTVITSIIAFFFFENFKINMSDENQIKGWLFVFLIVIFLLFLLLIGNFSISRYKSRSQYHLHSDFKPWDIGTYIWTGDEEFVEDMEKYAGRALTEGERVRVNILKEKINEFKKKNFLMCVVHAIIMFFLAIFMLCIFIYFSEM